MFKCCLLSWSYNNHLFAVIIVVFPVELIPIDTYFVTMVTLCCKVRDEYRSDFDTGRGGYGKMVQSKIGTT